MKEKERGTQAIIDKENRFVSLQIRGFGTLTIQAHEGSRDPPELKLMGSPLSETKIKNAIDTFPIETATDLRLILREKILLSEEYQHVVDDLFGLIFTEYALVSFQKDKSLGMIAFEAKGELQIIKGQKMQELQRKLGLAPEVAAIITRALEVSAREKVERMKKHDGFLQRLFRVSKFKLGL